MEANVFLSFMFVWQKRAV